MRSGVYWIIARVCIYAGGRSELCSLSANSLWHLLEVQGVLQNYELPVAVRGTLAFSFIRPVNGRSLSADTLVGSQEFTTEGDDGTATITGDNFLHRYQIL